MRYFLLKGELKERVKRFEEREKEAIAAFCNFCKKYGAIGIYLADDELVGLVYSADVPLPPSFHLIESYDTGERVAFPHKGSLLGQEIIKEFKPLYDAYGLFLMSDRVNRLFGAKECISDTVDKSIGFMEYVNVGDEYVLVVPDGIEWIPPATVQEISAQEFEKMKGRLTVV